MGTEGTLCAASLDPASPEFGVRDGKGQWRPLTPAFGHVGFDRPVFDGVGTYRTRRNTEG